jgi:hypothetical protein
MALVFPYIWIPSGGGQVEIVTWADGTPAQLAAMLFANDAGLIDINDYWSVGDERTEHLSAIAANPNGAFTKAMDAQDVVMMIMNEGYMNQQGIHFVVGQKDCLNQRGRMNATQTNTGSWKDSLMRADLNNLYYNAFSADFRALFKPFGVITAKTYNGSENETVQDYFSLFAEKEVVSSPTKSNTTEAAALSQIEYYLTRANRIKKVGESKETWFERSPTLDDEKKYCMCSLNGTAMDSTAYVSHGVAPFGCI